MSRLVVCLAVLAAWALPAGALADYRAAPQTGGSGEAKPEPRLPSVPPRIEQALGGEVEIAPDGLYRVDVARGPDVYTHGPDPVTPDCTRWDRPNDAHELRGSFDWVYSSHCLEHLEDPERDPITAHLAPRPWTALIGRVMLAGIFLVSGIAKVTDPAGTIDHMAKAGIPSPEILIWFAAFVPAVINSYSGVRAIEPHLVEAARTLGVPRAMFVREVLIPGAMPMIFTGLRLSLQACWTTLVAGELIGAIAGLGHVLYQASLDIFPAMIVVGMAAVAVTGAAMTALLGAVERRAMPWRAR